MQDWIRKERLICTVYPILDEIKAIDYIDRDIIIKDTSEYSTIGEIKLYYENKSTIVVKAFSVDDKWCIVSLIDEDGKYLWVDEDIT